MTPTENLLLAALPADVLNRLAPNLEPVALPLGKVIYESGVEMKHVYFPTSGCIISMLYVMADGSSAEIAVVGDEGVVGIALFMGGDTTPSRALVQSAGHGFRLEAKALRAEFGRHSDLQILLLRYTQALITQMSQTAVCNRHHSLEQQLCRWLLLSQDRLPTNQLTMTQELIANMLGVRREGVTQAAGRLQTAGLIRYNRGRITIVDRSGLEALVCECYAVVKNEYLRLLPPPRLGAKRREQPQLAEGKFMKAAKRSGRTTLAKVPAGIPGFDDLSYGGLKQNRTSLLIGGPGAGKTVFALQTLVAAARERDEPGIFVAFEETTRQIIADAAGFDWDLPALTKSQLFFLEAHLSPETVRSGEFDLRGMLGMLKAKKEEIGARWIVFDGIDVLLTLLKNPIAEMQEIYRIRDWLADNAINAIVTAKTGGGMSPTDNYDFMQFMMDCVIRLSRRLEHGVSLHRLQITKYRGSDFVAGEHPVSFGPSGMEVGAPEPSEIKHAASTERVSAGFERLDRMLGGGLFRGSSTLITGVPGTSKTTLAGKFAEAACLRGERTLFVSFDEGADPIVRNLASVGIALKPHVKSGLLRIYSGRTESIGAEDHLVKIKSLLREHRPRCMVVDPVSALAKAGGLIAARAVANRLVYLVKDAGVTVLITAISEGDDPQTEATELQVSTVADTWIHLSYIVRSGERNRALTIIKSRGTWHSNQVRELILSKAGPMLSDVYTAGGEVLMGTLRWEKEREEKTRAAQQRDEFAHKRGNLEVAEADTHARITALQLNLERQRLELARLSKDNDAHVSSSSKREQELGRIRSADPPQRTIPLRAKRNGSNGSNKAKTAASRSAR